MHIITRNGKMYVFEKKDDLERDDMFLERTRFIVNNVHKGLDFGYLEKMSYIYVNVKVLGVAYSSNVMNELWRIST